LRQELVNPCAKDAPRVIAVRAFGIVSTDGGGTRAHACVPRQQEIGEPMREIEVTPLEEPVPDSAPVEEPGESPAQPVRVPERVPA